MQQQQVDSRNHTPRNAADQQLPERKKPGVYHRTQPPAAIGQRRQRSRGDGDIATDGDPLHDMHDEMHAEGEEQGQPRQIIV